MAEIITEPITLDISHPQQWVRIRIQQGDVNSKQIDVSITDDGDTYVIPQGSVVQLEMMKSDNLPIFNPCTVVNNNARFEISEQMTATSGMGVAKIKITDVSTGGTLHTVPFYIYCDEEVLNESIIISTGEFTALTDALVQMSAYQLRFVQIGNLSLLNTTSSTDLVGAINENKASIDTKFDKSKIIQSDAIGGADNVPSADVTKVLGQEIDAITAKNPSSAIQTVFTEGETLLGFTNVCITNTTKFKPDSIPDITDAPTELSGKEYLVEVLVGTNAARKILYLHTYNTAHAVYKRDVFNGTYLNGWSKNTFVSV